MLHIKASLTTMLALLSIVLAASINDECEFHQNEMTCKCIGNKEFTFPDDKTYKNTTTLRLSSCSKATLLYADFFRAQSINDVIIENISKLLVFETNFYVNISRLELRNIEKIPSISYLMFNHVLQIKHLEIRNVFIEKFDVQFENMKVIDLVMVNVTIADVEWFNFTERGRNLKIINCKFRNITKYSTFNFDNVTIINSVFQMQTVGNLNINSNYLVVQDNIFFNAQMKLDARYNITINGTCADGRSSLRLRALDIKNFNNKWPTEIVVASMPGSKNTSQDNIICLAGYCKCPTDNGQNTNRAATMISPLTIFLIWLMYAKP